MTADQEIDAAVTLWKSLYENKKILEAQEYVFSMGLITMVIELLQLRQARIARGEPNHPIGDQ
jgi:hypothetical protein